MDETKDYDKEYEDLMAARKVGRTDGDGPADVAEEDLEKDEEVSADGNC